MKRLFYSITLLALFTFVAVQNTYAQGALDNARKLYSSHDLEAAAAQIQLALKDSPSNVDVLNLAGDIYRDLEQGDKAILYFKKSYESNNSNNVTARKYAMALSAADKHDQAIEIMRKAVKNDKADVYNQLVLGEVLVNADSLNAAELILTKAREMNRNIPDGFLALGSLYYRQHIYEAARDNYEQAIKIDSTNETALERLATMYFRQANAESDAALAGEFYTRSLQQWASVIRINPKNARAYFEQGKILYYAQKFQAAAPSLAQYLRLRPDADNAAIAHWFLAQAYTRFQACDSAAPHFRYVIEKIDSVKSKAMLLFARCNFDTKKYAQAAELFGDLGKLNVALDADDKERYGYSLMLSGDTVHAIEQIRGAIELNSTKCKTMERLANLYYDRKMYDDAITLYKKILASCQNIQASRINAFIGRSFFSANQADSAAIYLNAAIAMDSTQMFARSLAVRSYVSAAHIDDAIKIFQGALSYAVKDADKYKTDIEGMARSICGALLEKKDYKELKKVAASWAEFDKGNEWQHLFMAISYQGLGEKDGACKEYRDVLKINPANKVAKDNIKALGC